MDYQKLLATLKQLDEGTMAVAEKHPRGPSFPGYWKGTDPASAAKSKMVGGAEESREPNILKDLSKHAKKTQVQRRLKEEFDAFKKDQTNPTDVVKLDVPLMIRLLEYARKDAKTDMDLHNVAEQLISLSQENRTLNMQDYDSIVKAPVNEYGNAQNPNAQNTTPDKTGTAQADKETSAQAGTTDQQVADTDAKDALAAAAINKNINLIATNKPQINKPLATTAINKPPGTQLTPGEKSEIFDLGNTLGAALKTPQGTQVATQINRILNQVGQQNKQQQAAQKPKGTT